MYGMEQRRNAVERIGLVFTSLPREGRDDFLTHIPIRIKKLLGDEIDLYVIYGGCLNEGRLVRSRIHPLRIPFRRVFLLRFLYPCLLFVYTFIYIRRYNLNLLMNANDHLWACTVAFAASLSGKKSVARIAGNIQGIPMFHKSSSSSYVKRVLKLLLEKISLYSVDKILCVSESLKSLTETRVRCGHKIKVIPPGVDTDLFCFRPRNVVNGLKITRLVFVGRLEPIKGLTYALDAFGKLRANGYELVFDIYGDGSLKERLKASYGETLGVNFHGFVPHDEVPGIFSKGGILILPSLSEGSPLVLTEAMASGIPVIATSVGGSPELLRGGINGILVPPMDSEAIYRAVMKYLTDGEFLRRCIHNAYEYVCKYHSLSAVRQQYLDFFSNV